MGFFSEIKRRNVARAGIAYLAVAWVVLQIVDVVAPILEFPDWVAKTVLLVLAVGFIVAVIAAWFYELTPDGLKRDEEVDRSQPGASLTRAFTGRLIIVFLGLAVLMLLADRITGFSEVLTSGGEAQSVSLVVLPLDNVMRNEEQAYFVQGMHDALIVELTKIDALNVISRTSSLKYRDTELSLPEIARELNVDMVIEGSVLHAGDQVRISTQLIAADSDRHIWGSSFDREVTDILSLYSDVAQQIARQVEVEITPADLQRLGGAGQVDPAAYQKYLEARFLLDTWSPQEMLRGLELMREAVALDPDSALINAGLALGLQYTSWFNFVDPLAVADEARRSADRAVELDPASADAWVAQGAVSYYLEFDIPVAVRAFEKALELHPGNQQAYVHYAWLLGEAGQFEKAIPLAQRSIELDPFSAVAHGGLAQIHYLSRNFEESLRIYEETLDLDRRDPSPYFFLAWPHVQLGNIEKAIEYSRIAVEMSAGAHLYRMGLAYVLGISGQEEEARGILAELESENAQPIIRAEVHLGLGEFDKAIELLELAYEARNSTVVYILQGPRFDPLRGHPRFEALVERIGWREHTFH